MAAKQMVYMGKEDGMGYIESGPSSSSSSSDSEDYVYFKSPPKKQEEPVDDMDKNDGIIRWSPSKSRDEFLHINFSHRVVQIYAATGRADAEKFDYEGLTKHVDYPSLHTYDWSPVHRGLLAIGTSHGDVQLLRVDDDSNATLTLPLKLQRSCQTVAFNTTGLLAVGLDRVRNDPSLQIWDVNQCLAGWDQSKSGFSTSNMTLDPMKKLEASVSVSSVRFFEDQPQALIVGIKNQFIRLHDVRDPNSAVVTFPTRSTNNLAINYAEPHYFASSTLDPAQPGFVIWDRRAANRPLCSEFYLDAVENDGYPYGSVLNKEEAIEKKDKVSVKQLRFSRECSGALGVLSTAGELQVYQIKKEYMEPQDQKEGSPWCLEIKKSTLLSRPYFDVDYPTRQEDRIVSFDWMNVGTNDISARVVALRANSKFEVLAMPEASAGLAWNLMPTPVHAPHRLGQPYMTLMKFNDPKLHEANLGPLFLDMVMKDVPVFGKQSFKNPEVTAAIRIAYKELLNSDEDLIVDSMDPANRPKMASSTTAEVELEDFKNLKLDKGKEKATLSSREQHDRDHYATRRCLPGSKKHHEVLHHVMLQRANDGYLFNCRLNKKLVQEDPWLQGLWEWVEGAELAAADNGMVTGSLDLSYLGVFTIWKNLLGVKAQSRLIDSTVIPDPSQWERLISSINSRAGNPEFVGVATSKPHHRALCLASCGLAKPLREFEQFLDTIVKEDRHTCAAAIALFEGYSELAVGILKSGGSSMVSVAMALDMKLSILRGPSSLQMDADKWTSAIKEDFDLALDPYLHAIYNFIATGGWDAIADQNTLPLRSRVGVALRNFDDDKLTAWLEKEMNEAIAHGDIEGIVLAGITDQMADIFMEYVHKFGDHQTPSLVMAFCYPRYITDDRLDAVKKTYYAYLNRFEAYVKRVQFHTGSTNKSRGRDGKPVIPPPIRQVTIRCLQCDADAVNDTPNSGRGQKTSAASGPVPDVRNPLQSAGVNTGLSCPKCGSHLNRCGVCQEIVGMPRSDRPELSHDPEIRRLAKFPMFCLKCRHASHADHANTWFERHLECPLPECGCQCNKEPMWDRGMGK